MKNGTIQELFGQVIDIINQIRNNGDKMDYVSVIWKILRSFPKYYDHIMAVIVESSKDLSKLSLTELMDSLLKYENRTRRFTE